MKWLTINAFKYFYLRIAFPFLNLSLMPRRTQTKGTSRHDPPLQANVTVNRRRVN